MHKPSQGQFTQSAKPTKTESNVAFVSIETVAANKAARGKRLLHRAGVVARAAWDRLEFCETVNECFMRLLVLSLLLLALPVDAASSGVVLLYHHVATDTPASTSISPRDFRSHLEYLRDNEFSVIALDVMVEALRNGEELPDRAVAITFDDGYLSIFETAFPMLRSFGFPFTLFLSTGPIDRRSRNYMSWPQIEEMAAAGVMVANHMVEHPHMLERAEGESETMWIERLREELLRAERVILEHTGQSYRYLAYPYGEYNPAIKDMLRELDFIGFAQNSGVIGPSSDFLALPRYPLAGNFADLESASLKFATLPFNVRILEPESPVTNAPNPAVTLKFSPAQTGAYDLARLGCFANSQPLALTWIDREAGIVRLKPETTFSARRWRYICTAPNIGSRRFHWYSIQWINPEMPE